MSGYTGVCVYRLRDGTITDVQVKDAVGTELPLPAEEYERRGIQPSLNALPTCGKAPGDEI